MTIMACSREIVNCRVRLHLFSNTCDLLAASLHLIPVPQVLSLPSLPSALKHHLSSPTSPFSPVLHSPAQPFLWALQELSPLNAPSHTRPVSVSWLRPRLQLPLLSPLLPLLYASPALPSTSFSSGTSSAQPRSTLQPSSPRSRLLFPPICAPLAGSELRGIIPRVSFRWECCLRFPGTMARCLCVPLGAALSHGGAASFYKC